ncbi:hypothetical protein [Amycolatopsis sp. cg9]|uniref:hypothetical protein n=1 Tax=Amycolatopsis sp. cg9 TaxID=3238801 RepID=UPI0035265989
MEAGDPLTGWATVALAASTVATLLYSVITTRRDRKDADRRIQEQRDYDSRRAQQDQADAEARLEAERKAADRRLTDERMYTEKARQRERQQDSATRLLVRIASLLPLMNRVPNVFDTVSFALGGPRTVGETPCETESAVEGLRFGGFADLPGLRDVRATEQYRRLVHLVLTAARSEHQKSETNPEGRQEHSKLVAQDLWRYATFVRLSLEHLIEEGESLDPGEGGAGVSFPMLNRRLGDKSLWYPTNVPRGWQDAVSHDPDDPQYRPAK